MNLRSSPAFLARRWRGEVPLNTVLWRDMLGLGTVVNVLATFIALAAASQGAPTWVAAAIHFAPMPCNVFLFIAVARAVPRSRAASWVGLAWLAAMTVV